MGKVNQEPATMTPEEAANAHDWKGMAGAVAYHLIDRYAEGWVDIALMMDALARANYAPQVAQPQPQPLTDEQKRVMWRYCKRAHALLSAFDWYFAGVEDGERAHGIGQGVAPQVAQPKRLTDEQVAALNPWRGTDRESTWAVGFRTAERACAEKWGVKLAGQEGGAE